MQVLHHVSPFQAECSPAPSPVDPDSVPQVFDVDMALVGEQPPGAWVLVLMGVAREVLSPEEARQVNDGLEAVRLAMSGQSDLDHLFADLIERSPQRPPSEIPAEAVPAAAWEPSRRDAGSETVATESGGTPNER